MKSFFMISALVLSSLCFAETATYQVKGMHCGDCAAAVESHVCKMEGVKTCKVQVTNAKKQLGTVTLTTEDGKPIDAVKVEELVSAAGDYHVIRSTKK